MVGYDDKLVKWWIGEYHPEDIQQPLTGATTRATSWGRFATEIEQDNFVQWKEEYEAGAESSCEDTLFLCL